jgi:hypothetical protein
MYHGGEGNPAPLFLKEVPLSGLQAPHSCTWPPSGATSMTNASLRSLANNIGELGVDATLTRVGATQEKGASHPAAAQADHA